MAQDEAPMAAVWLKNLRTRVAAGVGDQPGVEHGVVLLAAVAPILGRDLLLRVALATFWATPLEGSDLVLVIAASGI